MKCPKCNGTGKLYQPQGKKDIWESRRKRLEWLSNHKMLCQKFIQGGDWNIDSVRKEIIGLMKMEGVLSPATYWVDVNLRTMINEVASVKKWKF